MGRKKQTEVVKAAPAASKHTIENIAIKRKDEKNSKDERRRTDSDKMQVDGKTGKNDGLQQQTIQQTLNLKPPPTPNDTNSSNNTAANPNVNGNDGNKNDISMDSAKSSKSGRKGKNKPSNPYKKGQDNDSSSPNAEYNCLILDKNIDFNDPALVTDLRAGITGATNFLNLIQSNSIYAEAGNEQFIHALCLLTKTPIDYAKQVEHSSLVEMFRDGLYMITHEKLDIERLRNWKYGIEVVREFSTARKNASLTKMLDSINDGYFKDANKINDWNCIARTLGIFLPEGSITVEYKQSLLQTALATLKKSSIEDLRIDFFSYAILASFSGFELSYNVTVPGILTDRCIPCDKRLALMAEFGLSLPSDRLQGKTYGTEEWCSAKQFCKIDLCCANTTCTQCGKPTHTDCGVPSPEGIFCSNCKSKTRWTCLPSSLIFDIQLPTNAIQLTTDSSIGRTTGVTPAAKGSTATTAKSGTNDVTPPSKSATATTITPATEGTTTDSTTPPNVKNDGKPAATTGTTSDTSSASSNNALALTAHGQTTPTAAATNTTALALLGKNTLAAAATTAAAAGGRVGFNTSIAVQEFDRQRPVNEITSRIQFKLKMPKVKEDDDELEVLILIVASIIERMEQVDPSISFIPWFSSVAPDRLDFKNMPQSIDTLREFMPRIMPRPGQLLYVDARITHERNLDAIILEISPWLRFRQHAMWVKRLQVERTVTVGWFLYSAESYHAPSISDALQHHFDTDVELRWQVIRCDRSEDLGPTPIKALAAIAPAETEDECRTALDEIYNFTTRYPLAISMKFIQRKDDDSYQIKSQIKANRTAQGIFLSSISSHTVDTITDLTWRPANIEGQPNIPNLRTMIMGVRTGVTNDPMFTGVTVDRKFANKTTFTFKNRCHKTAPEYARTLAGRVYHLYKERSMGFFTTAAATEGARMIYVPETDTFLTQDVVNMNRLTKMIKKRRELEKAKDEQAQLLGEFSDDEAKAQDNAMRIIAPDEFSVISNDDDTAKTYTTLQQHVLNVMDGTSVNDIGSVRSGRTRQSQRAGYVGDCDRSSVQDQFSCTSRSTTKGNAGFKTSTELVTQQRHLIDNIELLQEQEKAFLEKQHQYLQDVKVRQQFEAYCKFNNIELGESIDDANAKLPATGTSPEKTTPSNTPNTPKTNARDLPPQSEGSGDQE